MIAPADVLASIKSASQIVRSAVDSDVVRDGYGKMLTAVSATSDKCPKERPTFELGPRRGIEHGIHSIAIGNDSLSFRKISTQLYCPGL